MVGDVNSNSFQSTLLRFGTTALANTPEKAPGIALRGPAKRTTDKLHTPANQPRGGHNPRRRQHTPTYEARYARYSAGGNGHAPVG